MAISKTDKAGFKDIIAIKTQHTGDKPIDGKKSPWDFTCPQYDQRSSCFVSAGVDYGDGHRNPVGHKEGAKDKVSTLPYGTHDKALKHEKD